MNSKSLLIEGDCLEKMKHLPDESIDSIVTDPPYGYKFMGKKWDYDVPKVEVWEECLRVLKPGGFLLSFAGTRTQHRMAVNIEDAGFEIRDMIAWVYGSGFPKSHNIGKAVDKLQGNEREIIGKRIIGRAGTRADKRNANQGFESGQMEIDDTKGSSKYEGWGTVLKPALEPITVARKPFKGTVTNNVLKYGTGGINIDGCRVETEDNLNGGAYADNKNKVGGIYGKLDYEKTKEFKQPQGRFPANLIHDGSEEVEELFPDTKSGILTKGKSKSTKNTFGEFKERSLVGVGDSGSASRFFYVAKVSKKERNFGLESFEEKQMGCNQSSLDSGKMLTGSGNERSNLKANSHPTVKPIKLMQYLVRLVTPKNGLVLDPYVGSGSTGIACKLESFRFIGIDDEKDYIDIARARIKAWGNE